MEQQYSDAVFKTVPQRIAATLCTLGDRAQGLRRPSLIGGGPTQVVLTHEQIAALVGTSRETATKALGEFAEQGLVKLGRGKIFIIDRTRLADEAGEQW
jgi:CRP-like cAMP-binding protein